MNNKSIILLTLVLTVTSFIPQNAVASSSSSSSHLEAERDPGSISVDKFREILPQVVALIEATHNGVRATSKIAWGPNRAAYITELNKIYDKFARFYPQINGAGTIAESDVETIRGLCDQLGTYLEDSRHGVPANETKLDQLRTMLAPLVKDVDRMSAKDIVERFKDFADWINVRFVALSFSTDSRPNLTYRRTEFNGFTNTAEANRIVSKISESRFVFSGRPVHPLFQQLLLEGGNNPETLKKLEATFDKLSKICKDMQNPAFRENPEAVQENIELLGKVLNYPLNIVLDL